MGFEEDIKRPFDVPSFEFREEYWQAAQRMIDRDFRRRRWLRVLWITAGVGLVAGSLILASAWFGDSATQEERQPAILPDPIAHTEQHDERSGEEVGQRDMSPVSAADHTSAESAGVHAGRPQGLAENAAGSGQPGQSGRMLSTDDSGAEAADSRRTVSKQPAGASKEAVVTGDIQADPYLPDHSTVAPGNKVETGMTAKEAHTSAAIPAKGDPAPQNGLARTEEDTRNTSVSQVLTGQQGQMTHTGDMLATAPARSLPVALAPVQAQSVEAAVLPFVTVAAVEPGAITAAPRKSRFFAVVESMQYPGADPQALRWLGLNAGIAWQQPVGRMLFVETGLRAAVRRGSYDASQISNQLDFDFGPRDNAYILRPKAVYSLQIPLLIGAELGRHQVSAGVLPAFLLGVRGTSEYGRYLHSWEGATPGDDRVYEVLDKGWIETDGFRRFALTYALRYQFRWTERLGIGVSAQYMPKDWIGADFGKFYNFDTDSYQVPNASGSFLVERNWIMGVELRYAF